MQTEAETENFNREMSWDDSKGETSRSQIDLLRNQTQSAPDYDNIASSNSKLLKKFVKKKKPKDKKTKANQKSSEAALKDENGE